MSQEGALINTTSNNPKLGLVFEKNVYEAQILMDKVFNLLRPARDEVTRPTKTGGRELSEAITAFETGCMFMNRSLFSAKPYSPILPREDKKE